jgi:hypothetical protein
MKAHGLEAKLHEATRHITLVGTGHPDVEALRRFRMQQGRRSDHEIQASIQLRQTVVVGYARQRKYFDFAGRISC